MKSFLDQNMRFKLYLRNHTSIIILLCCLFSPGYASAPIPAGWVEKAILYPAGITINAKLDTGAKTTSINASNPEYFERGGKQWARFSITNRHNKSTTIEAPIVRQATIKRHFGKKQERPVIMLDICIGNVRKKAEVNLVDRSELNYQLLIGRNFLKGSFLIDSGSTYKLSLDCPE
jgi:hypothetical protein